MTTEEIVTILIGIFTGLVGGAGFSWTLLKKQLGNVPGSLSPTEVIQVLYKVNRALDANSPAGEQITGAEAEALGRAVWAALKTDD